MQDRRKIAIINADFFTVSSPEKVREGNIRFVRDGSFNDLRPGPDSPGSSPVTQISFPE